MLIENIIRPAQPDRAAPVVIIPKKKETVQFCVDYRKLDAVIKHDSYPTSRMDEYVDSLGKATILSMLDGKRGYLQIEIEDYDKDKTAFTSHHG